MSIESADLLGWSFTTERFSAGVYRATGRDHFGLPGVIEVLDLDAVLEACWTATVAISKDIVKAG